MREPGAMRRREGCPLIGSDIKSLLLFKDRVAADPENPELTGLLLLPFHLAT
jgi:hypothetical protein